jgi:hypothetical protein
MAECPANHRHFYAPGPWPCRSVADFTFQLVAAAVDLSEIVIGQLTPFLLDLVFRGFPVPFNLIPINSLTSKPALLRAQTT